MSAKTPEQPNPPNPKTDAPMPRKARAKKLTPPISLAGGTPNGKTVPPVASKETAVSSTQELAVPSSSTEAVPTTSTTMAGEPSPGVTTDDLKAAFETECQGIRDQIIAHVLGWYAIADTTASVCVRYQGRVQNVAVAIAEALGRSPRFVYNLLAISKHPSELRARVREVGMSDEQRRLLQLNALDDSLQAEALTAYGQGGGQAFDAAIQDAKGASGPIANAPLANVLAQFADPTQALGGIAAAAPDTPLPATLKEKFPELSKCKTYGDVLGMTSASNTPQPEGGTGTKPTKKGGGKGKPERDWGRGFNLHIDAEKTISLNKSEFAILLAGVFDAKGDKVEGAWVKFHVVDRK